MSVIYFYLLPQPYNLNGNNKAIKVLMLEASCHKNVLSIGRLAITDIAVIGDCATPFANNLFYFDDIRFIGAYFFK